MISNKQYFDSEFSFVKYNYDQMLSGHYWNSFSIDQSSPVLIVATWCTIIVVAQLWFKSTLEKIGYVMTSTKIEVDEDLPPFFTALKLKWCDWMVEEYTHYYEEYGIEIANKQVIDILDDTKVPEKTLQGIPFYNILANPDYTRDFYYIDTLQPSRADQIKDDDDNEDNDLEQSDLVVLLLNLGCIPHEAAVPDFKPGFNLTFKQVMKEKGFLKKED